MKKTVFLVLIFALVFSLSACSQKEENNIETKEKNQNKIESISGSIKDLIAKGKDLKCTYSINDLTGQGKVTGTTYISGEKSFSETELKGSDQDMETNVLVDGEYMYTWSSIMPQGTKINMQKLEELDDTEDYEEYVEAYNEDYDYKCSSWKKDDSQFEVPADIEFVDLTPMMEGMNSSMGKTMKGNSDDMCSMCDMITDQEQKEECLINLGCE